ncbi:MAG: hypothetical protein IJ845_05180 [Bacteroidaceae bacterium]|nr:hypothetical protein [Clostridia bacterium]MBR1940709.1 hypothetical protein [Bacteroidaceae bacterium]
MIKFHYASENTKDGKIINISDVDAAHRAKHYYCISCGHEMTAALGKKNEHHFRHKGDHCGWETYLHELGKRIIKEKFENQDKFLISYKANYICNSYEQCHLKSPLPYIPKCIGEKLHIIDLKQYYDTCEVESTYRGFRADLKLSNSEHPEWNPTFIEIAVSHDCEKVKIDSGIRIVELKVKEEADIHKPLIESDEIRFYNFKREIKASLKIDRLCIIKNNEGLQRVEVEQGLDCGQMETHKDNSVFEFCISSESVKDINNMNFVELGLSVANIKNVPLKHCAICYYYNSFHSIPCHNPSTNTISIRHITISSIPDEICDKFLQAKNCRRFNLDLKKRHSALAYLNNHQYFSWSPEKK